MKALLEELNSALIFYFDEYSSDNFYNMRDVFVNV
jgi:hypothetical protein